MPARAAVQPGPALARSWTPRPTTVGGPVFEESELGDAIGEGRRLLGEGTTVAQGQRRNRLALAPYLAGAVFLPLVLLLWRRDR